MTCECGCGSEVTKGRRFISGHNSRNGNRAGVNNGQFNKASWNKGLTQETDIRVKQYVESGKGKRGHVAWNKGKAWDILTRKKISASLMGKYLTSERISVSNYSNIFGRMLKKIIKERDNFTCQVCKITENEHHIKFSRNLSVHHKDCDKQNNNENNLITLCNKCHSKIHKEINRLMKI